MEPARPGDESLHFYVEATERQDVKKLGGLILAEINVMWKEYRPVECEDLLSALPSTSQSKDSKIEAELGDPFFNEDVKLPKPETE